MVSAQSVLPIPSLQEGALYPTYEASTSVVLYMVGMSGIPLGRLGKLLGVKGYHHVYRWAYGVRRPSAVILSRYIQLLHLKNARKISLSTIRSIDWEQGVAYLNDGADVNVGDKPAPGPVIAWSNTGARREHG